MNAVTKAAPITYPTAFSKWGDEEQEAIQRVIASGRFTIGPEVAAFEAEFAAAHNMNYGVMVNSGSSANLIAVASLFHKQDRPLKRADKVLVPALAWSTTYAPLVQHGLDVTLADADETWCAEPRLLTGARLIIGCSILGNPAHLEQWRHIAIRSGAYFMEDNCESAFARTAFCVSVIGARGFLIFSMRDDVGSSTSDILIMHEI